MQNTVKKERGGKKKDAETPREKSTGLLDRNTLKNKKKETRGRNSLVSRTEEKQKGRRRKKMRSL